MKSLLYFLGISFLYTIGISCSNNDDAAILAPDDIVLTASLDGANETPTNSSTAKGVAYVIYSKTTKAFSINVSYSGLAPTMALIHKKTEKNPDPIVFTIGKYTDYYSTNGNSANALPTINFTSPPLTTEQEADLLANRYYVKLCSIAYPEGDISGQLINSNLDGNLN